MLLYIIICGDFRHQVTGDWMGNIKYDLLRQNLQMCLAERPEERFAGDAQIARHLRDLPARRAALEKQRAELAAKERRAYRRGLVRAAAYATAVVAAFAILALVAADQARRARALSEQSRGRLRRLTVGNG